MPRPVGAGRTAVNKLKDTVAIGYNTAGIDRLTSDEVFTPTVIELQSVDLQRYACRHIAGECACVCVGVG